MALPDVSGRLNVAISLAAIIGGTMNAALVKEFTLATVLPALGIPLGLVLMAYSFVRVVARRRDVRAYLEGRRDHGGVVHSVAARNSPLEAAVPLKVMAASPTACTSG